MTSIFRLNKSTNAKVSTGKHCSGKRGCFDDTRKYGVTLVSKRARERERARQKSTQQTSLCVAQKAARNRLSDNKFKGPALPRGAGLRRNVSALAGISITAWLSCCRWPGANFLKAPRWSRSAKFFLFVCLFKFMNGVFFTSSRRRRRRQRCCVKPKKASRVYSTSHRARPYVVTIENSPV